MTQLASEDPDPRDFLRLLVRRKWILLACVVLLPLAAYVVSTRLPKTYQAAVVLQLQDPAVPSSIAGVLTEGAGNPQTVDRVAALIETNGVADAAARELDLPKGSLRGDVTASADEDTGFITVTAQASTAKGAADVANAFAEAIRTTRTQQGEERVGAAIENVEAQLEQVPRSDEIARDELERQLQGLTTLRGAQDQNAEVLEAAIPPGAPASPDPVKNAILALIAALALGAGLVALIDRLDRRIHDPDELERFTGAPLLVRVPPSAFVAESNDPSVAVAFQMLRDSVMFFNVDARLETLVIVSSQKGEGKTTVAANLGMAYARAGKRVVLVDADLRSPQLGPRMGVDRDPGLSQVLAGYEDLHGALREVGLGQLLRVLPGGPPPPNPSELLSSARMTSILDTLKQESDLVIVDTPPLLLVSDAFGVLEQSSGAIAVVRLEHTPKEAVARMAKVVSTVETRLLGVVATGGTAGSHGYGYGYGYGEMPEPAPSGAAPSPTAVVAAATNGQPSEDVAGADGAPARKKRLFRR